MFKELENLFGAKFEEREIKFPKGLPIYMTSGRKLYQLSLDDASFIVVSVSEMNRFGVVALQKQQLQYEEFLNCNVAFSFPHLTKVQRDALIKHKVPFIDQANQIYLPFLGIMLTDKFKKERNVSVEKMMPATQSLYLYLLSKKYEAVSKMDAAEALSLTRMSISRASAQLEAMGLITQQSVGRNVFMKAKAYGMEGYKMAEPYLINPVKKTIVVKSTSEMFTLPAAGETALSSYSMLGEPDIPIKAISKDSDMVSSLEETDRRWDPESQSIELQLWKYDPCLYTVDGMVDKISLAMSFKDNVDERIEAALESCMEGLDD